MTDILVTGAPAAEWAASMDEAGFAVAGPISHDDTEYWAVRFSGAALALPEGVNLVDPEVAATIHSWM